MEQTVPAGSNLRLLSFLDQSHLYVTFCFFFAFELYWVFLPGCSGDHDPHICLLFSLSQRCVLLAGSRHWCVTHSVNLKLPNTWMSPSSRKTTSNTSSPSPLLYLVNANAFGLPLNKSARLWVLPLEETAYSGSFIDLLWPSRHLLSLGVNWKAYVSTRNHPLCSFTVNVKRIRRKFCHGISKASSETCTG